MRDQSSQRHRTATLRDLAPALTDELNARLQPEFDVVDPSSYADDVHLWLNPDGFWELSTSSGLNAAQIARIQDVLGCLRVGKKYRQPPERSSGVLSRAVDHLDRSFSPHAGSQAEADERSRGRQMQRSTGGNLVRSSGKGPTASTKSTGTGLGGSYLNEQTYRQ